MTDMKRTTGGLLQGEQSMVTPDDFASAVRFLETRVKNNPALRRVLGLDIAKQFAAAPAAQQVTVGGNGIVVGKTEAQDLQRSPRKR